MNLTNTKKTAKSKNNDWLKFHHFSSILGKIPTFPVHTKFPDIFLTGKCAPIFQLFQMMWEP